MKCAMTRNETINEKIVDNESDMEVIKSGDKTINEVGI